MNQKDKMKMYMLGTIGVGAAAAFDLVGRGTDVHVVEDYNQAVLEMQETMMMQHRRSAMPARYSQEMFDYKTERTSLMRSFSKEEVKAKRNKNKKARKARRKNR